MEIELAMHASPSKRGFTRLARIRRLLMGHPRKVVCEIFDRSDRMVRLWIEMFNCGGMDALVTKPQSGRTRKVKREQLRDLLLPVLEDPSLACQRRWTGVKLHGWLCQKHRRTQRPSLRCSQ
jgi:transposase